MAKEKDTLNGALVEAHAAVLGKAELLSKANDSINDLKLKLEGFEGTLSEVRAQEEDLTAREAKLAAALRGKDEELEALVAWRTRELEQRHKEALDAQALVHAGKVKELEVERDGLKDQVLELAKEEDTINDALVGA